MKNKILIGMIVINLLSMISGFIRDSSIAIQMGATSISDVFMFIINLPTVLFSALGWVIMSTFIPIYTDIKMNQDDKRLNKFTNTFIKICLLICLMLVILLCFYNRVTINILAPGFYGDEFNLTKNLFFIIIPSLIFLGISFCIVAILNANKKMIWTSLLGVPINIITIFATIFIYPKYGIELTTLAITIGSIVPILIFMYPLKDTGFKLTKEFDLKDKNIKRTLTIIGPMIIGVMAQQINSMFSGAITSTLASGSLTSYNLANKIVNAAYSSIILIAISYVFPYLAQDYAEKLLDIFKEKVVNFIHLIFIVLLPITILIIELSEEIVILLYGYGNFTSEAINLTSNILVLSSIGIIFMGIRELLSRAYYGAQNTITPMKHNILGIVLNIILGICLARRYGVLGVAIASSGSIIVSTFTIIYKFKKDFSIPKQSILTYIKYFLLCIIVISATSFIRENLINTTNVFFTIILTSIFSLVIYIMALIIFRVDIKSYLNTFK